MKEHSQPLSTDSRNDISAGRTFSMGLAMIAVMVFHLGLFPVGMWGVDVFLFVSGFGCYYSLSKDNHAIPFYKRRLLRVLPYAIPAGWIILSCALFLHFRKNGLSPLPYDDPYIRVFSHLFGLNLWYIRAILIFYLLSPFLFNLLKSKHIAFFILPLILIPYCLSYPLMGYFHMLQVPQFSFAPMTFVWPCWRFPIFVTGMLVAHQGGNFFNVKFAILAIFSIALSLYLHLVGVSDWGTFQNVGLFLLKAQWLLLIPSIIFFCTAMGKVANRIPTAARIFVNFFGRYSLELYLVHECIYLYVDKAIPVRAAAVIVGPVLSVLVAFALHHAVSKLPGSGCRKQA